MPTAQPPYDFTYNVNDNTLSWSCDETSIIEFEIEVQLQGTSDWDVIYTGNKFSCPFNEVAGTYNVKGKTRNSGGWGEKGDVEVITKPAQ